MNNKTKQNKTRFFLQIFFLTDFEFESTAVFLNRVTQTILYQSIILVLYKTLQHKHRWPSLYVSNVCCHWAPQFLILLVFSYSNSLLIGSNLLDVKREKSLISKYHLGTPASFQRKNG